MKPTASPETTYTPFQSAGIIVTGVRSTSATSDSVVLTASAVSGGVTTAALYQGSLAAAPAAPIGDWHLLAPVFEGQVIGSSTFYGPNTFCFDPRLGPGNVAAVGSYKVQGSPADHGMLYEGDLAGTGTWTQLDATPLVAEGETLLNTIAHSTMGDLVVGNYDTDLATGRAFIYNKATGAWTDLNPGGTKSVTAYGIWQNESPQGTVYTIAGGQSGLASGELDESYLVSYDSATGAFAHYRTYRYDNQPDAATLVHFDGITATANGFNLTGVVTTDHAISGFLASVPVQPDGSFGDAGWTPVTYPEAKETTGNTIVDNHVLGIFIAGGTQSYLATVLPTNAR